MKKERRGTEPFFVLVRGLDSWSLRVLAPAGGRGSAARMCFTDRPCACSTMSTAAATPNARSKNNRPRAAPGVATVGAAAAAARPFAGGRHPATPYQRHAAQAFVFPAQLHCGVSPSARVLQPAPILPPQGFRVGPTAGPRVPCWLEKTGVVTQSEAVVVSAPCCWRRVTVADAEHFFLIFFFFFFGGSKGV